MVYKERLDKRDWEETRPVEAKVGIIPNAHGSAMFKIGKTWALAAVYGPRALFPRFLQNPTKGLYYPFNRRGLCHHIKQSK